MESHSLPKTKQAAPYFIAFSELKFTIKLGEGGKGTVQLAQYNGKKVAVKSMVDEETSFNREKHVMDNLPQHPNLITFYGYSISYQKLPLSRPIHHLIMEPMVCDLYHYIATNPKPEWGISLDIMQKITQGLVYMHNKGYLHRDIKPANVLMGEKNEIKLTDFSFTKPINEIEKNGVILGTIGYVAPEILQSHSSKVHSPYSKKSDIYALGITFWEIGHRKEAYCGKTDQDVIERTIAGKREELTPSFFPPKARNLIQTCWHEIRTARPDAEKVNTILYELENDDRTMEIHSCHI